MSDRDFLNTLLLDHSHGPTRLFRQSVGQTWIGNAQHFKAITQLTLYPGDVVIRKARAFHAGIKGMGDLIGWHSTLITPDMIGRHFARYASIEAKQGTGQLESEQRNWMQQVIKAGGLAGIARSSQDAKLILSA